MHTLLLILLPWLALNIAVAVLLVWKPLPARRADGFEFRQSRASGFQGQERVQ